MPSGDDVRVSRSLATLVRSLTRLLTDLLCYSHSRLFSRLLLMSGLHMRRS